MHTIFSSTGVELHFPDGKLYAQYNRECQELSVKYYKIIREKYGIWAGNQGKFVPTRADLNDWDSKYMENLSK